MKRKLNLQFMIITAIAILATLAGTIFGSYEIFRKEIFQNLKNYGEILVNTGLLEENGKDLSSAVTSQIRMTVIARDGTVLFDSEVDEVTMDNHLERPEVVEAMKSGEGYAVRQSKTVSQSTFYYARDLGNGKILRVSEEAHSIFSIFFRVFPVLLLIAAVLFAVCMLLARMMTKHLLQPIDTIAENMENMDGIQTYPELIPFVQKINKQHQDILKSADLRQEFTANVTHELKTPLTAISGYSELIANGMAKEEDTVRFSKEIHRNADRLLLLINDILRLSELDVTEDRAPMMLLDLYEIADSSVQMLEFSAETHQVSMKMKGTRGCVIEGNRKMLDELVYNLCDNAIRYNNPGGKVIVEVKKEGDDTILSVKDTGIGVAKEEQERIFERFYRVDKSRSKSTGGTGLGLAIVKHIVKAHHAKLEVESELMKGTEITIRFPGQKDNI